MTKRTLAEIREIMKGLDEKYGVDTSTLPILHNKRLTRALGRCHYTYGIPTKFDFSTLCLNLEYETFRQVVMHEWAHAYNRIVHKGTGHDKTFKMTCQMIGCTNDGTKILDREALNIARKATPTNYKYAVRCKCCGTTSKYTRKNQVWKTIAGEMWSVNTYYCAKCKEHGTLEAVVLQ